MAPLEHIRLALEWAKNIAMFGHINPDWDCVWSLLWLGTLLTKQWKQVSYFTPTAPGNVFWFLPNIDKIQTTFDYGTYDLLVFVDFWDYARIQEFYEWHEWYFQDHTIVVLDHHISKWFDTNRLVKSDHTATSACEVILETTYPWRPELYDSQIATYFYLGVTTDSWNFCYDEQHERVFTNALKLIILWADKDAIINNVIRRRSFKWVKMMERLFSRLQQKGGLIYTWYILQDLEEIGVNHDEADLGQIVIQDIDDAIVTCIFREQNGTFHGSLRSKTWNVEQIASSFGGWWHSHAAWFKLPREGEFQDQINKISDKITTFIQ